MNATHNYYYEDDIPSFRGLSIHPGSSAPDVPNTFQNTSTSHYVIHYMYVTLKKECRWTTHQKINRLIYIYIYKYKSTRGSDIIMLDKSFCVFSTRLYTTCQKQQVSAILVCDFTVLCVLSYTKCKSSSFFIITYMYGILQQCYNAWC